MSRFYEPTFYDRRGPAPQAAADGLTSYGVYNATLLDAPSGGSVRVVIPALSDRHYYPATCSPVYTGSPGDSVLVICDEGKHPWVVSPSALKAMTPTGSAGGALTGSYPNPGLASMVFTGFNYSLSTSGYADASSFRPAAYAKRADGWVVVRGVVGKTSAWAVNDVIAVLPSGFRPAATESFVLGGQDSGYGTFALRVNVNTAGSILVKGAIPTIATPGTLVLLGLNPIAFQADGS